MGLDRKERETRPEVAEGFKIYVSRCVFSIVALLPKFWGAAATALDVVATTTNDCYYLSMFLLCNYW
ncbi:hypothetical protein DM860_004214 [Cuscuta australis]|uniref:Uncharacterized protein n=1 Tax=Cuscuta australis TaxID=267555 RepID=A0A328CVF3_9ASTE|nr:hypothetical protein DM860_004214 [Cuscuta australis]